MIYVEQSDGYLIGEGLSIPPNDENRHYRKAIADIASGISSVDLWAGSSRESAHNTDKAVSDWKSSREIAVSQIKVTVDSLEFDGDEISQGRMARAVVASSSDAETTIWVLANNTPTSVTALQLRQALKLAGTEQTRLWTP